MFILEIWFILIGVNWKVDGKELMCIVIDSYCLVLWKVIIEIGNEVMYNVVILGKSLSEFSKIFDDFYELVDIVIMEN